MRVYYTPEFVRKAENQTNDEKKAMQRVVAFLHEHSLKNISQNQEIAILSTAEPNLYILRAGRLRIYASLLTDHQGDYAILADFEKR